MCSGRCSSRACLGPPSPPCRELMVGPLEAAASSSLCPLVLSYCQMAGQPLTKPEYTWLTVTVSYVAWRCSKRSLICPSFAVWLSWPALALRTPRKLDHCACAVSPAALVVQVGHISTSVASGPRFFPEDSSRCPAWAGCLHASFQDQTLGSMLRAFLALLTRK